MHKTANIFYIIVYVSLTLFFSLFSFVNESVPYKNNCYSFLRVLSSSDTDWAIGNYSYIDDNIRVKDLRSEIREANDSYGFFRETLTSHIVALDENHDFLDFDCSYIDVSLESTRLITLSDFCDGNTSSNGKLYTIPIQLMFTGNFCDITKYSDSNSVGSSYIPIDMANAIISIDSSINEYEDLLGKKYLINNSPFTINNIFYTNSYLAPYFLKYYGKFIVTDSSTFLDDFNVSITSAYKADSISQDDYFNFFSKKNVAINNFTYLKNDKWQTDGYTSFFKGIVSSKYNSNFFSNVYTWLSVFAFAGEGVLIFYLIKHRSISRKTFLTLLFISLTIVSLVTVGNLLFYTNVTFLNILNNYLALHAVINIVLLLIVPHFKRNLKKQYIGGYYEINL